MVADCELALCMDVTNAGGAEPRVDAVLDFREAVQTVLDVHGSCAEM